MLAEASASRPKKSKRVSYIAVAKKVMPWLVELYMRFKDSVEQKSLLKKAINENKMEEVFLGLNALGANPWRINGEIFDVVLQVWNSGERMGKIPPAEFDIPEPAKNDAVEIDPHERMTYISRMRKWRSSEREPPVEGPRVRPPSPSSEQI